MRVLDPWVPFLRNSVPFFSSTQDLRPEANGCRPFGAFSADIGNRFFGYLRHFCCESWDDLMGMISSACGKLLRWFYTLRRDCRVPDPRL